MLDHQNLTSTIHFLHDFSQYSKISENYRPKILQMHFHKQGHKTNIYMCMDSTHFFRTHHKAVVFRVRGKSHSKPHPILALRDISQGYPSFRRLMYGVTNMQAKYESESKIRPLSICVFSTGLPPTINIFVNPV